MKSSPSLRLRFSRTRKGFLAIFALLVCILPVTHVALEKFRNYKLIADYMAAGTAATGTAFMPGETMRNDMPNPGDPIYINYEASKTELRRRGKRCVPDLIAFLEEEAPKQRNTTDQGQILSFTEDVLELLVETGDARGAGIALKILKGWNGQVDRSERSAALRALEKLTYVSFNPVRPREGQYRDCVEHPDAGNTAVRLTLEESALAYTKWLAGEGKDPAHWLPLARARAHKLLSSENLEHVYCAAEFLRPEKGRDDQPEATMSRLAEIIGRMDLLGDGIHPFIDGKPVVGGGGNWIQFLTDYGPRARKFSKLLINMLGKPITNQQGIYSYLRNVGGPEIMAFFFERLPIVSAEVEKIKNDPATPKFFGGDDPRHAWIGSQFEIYSGIARWTGHLFTTDAERQEWWKANQGRTPEQWLSDNLETITEQADENKHWAAWISRNILPDLPIGANDDELTKSLIPPPYFNPIHGPYRSAWLRHNRSKLCYDENGGCFRLKQ